MGIIMEKLLVAVDGSESAQKAAEKAVTLAKVLPASVTVISVAVPAPAPIHWSGTHFYYDQLFEKQEKLTEKILENYKAFFEDHNIIVKTILKVGDPATEICQFANSDDFSLIIMGSKGLTGIKRVLIGSVANYVVQTSKIPVLVVK
jgi:nucleotide-binding universal stress UspA family protein